MDMTGDYLIPASREAVWSTLNDLSALKEAIPGCEYIAYISANEIDAVVTAKIGPVKASFKGLITLSDLDPPRAYTIRGEGKGGAAGFAKGGARVRLEQETDGTRLIYTVDASIGGKIAQVGGRLITSAAQKLADEFFARLGALAAARDARPA